jgi:hypothetical protein
MRALFVMGTLAAAVLMLFAAASPADADFHLMQIEQIIGGVNGDTTAQAIQLRMRADGQGGLTKGRLVAYDATGKNAVVLIDFPMDIFPEVQGERILIASRPFSSHTNPAAAPDFVLANMIPPSYLEAGSLTFEHEGQLGRRRLHRPQPRHALQRRRRKLRPARQRRAALGLDFGPAVRRRRGRQEHEQRQDYVVTGGPGSAGPTVFTNSKGETFVVTQ